MEGVCGRKDSSKRVHFERRMEERKIKMTGESDDIKKTMNWNSRNGMKVNSLNLNGLVE